MAARTDAPTASSTPRLKAATAVGERRATLSASARARASPASSDAHVSSTSPIRIASCASIVSPVIPRRSAWFTPTTDHSSAVPPAPGTIPSPVSGNPNCAPGAPLPVADLDTPHLVRASVIQRDHDPASVVLARDLQALEL